MSEKDIDKIDSIEVWCPECNRRKYYFFKDGRQLIEEFIKDIKREIRYIKTINNYQDFAGELKQCIWVEKLEEQLNRNIIEKWEKR